MNENPKGFLREREREREGWHPISVLEQKQAEGRLGSTRSQIGSW